jgi:hypothetical protein
MLTVCEVIAGAGTPSGGGVADEHAASSAAAAPVTAAAPHAPSRVPLAGCVVLATATSRDHRSAPLAVS